MKAIQPDNTLNHLSPMGINPFWGIPSNANPLLQFCDLYQSYLATSPQKENFNPQAQKVPCAQIPEGNPKVPTDYLSESAQTNAEQTMPNISNRDQPAEEINKIIRQIESLPIGDNYLPGQPLNEFSPDSSPELETPAISETIEQFLIKANNFPGQQNILVNNLPGRSSLTHAKATAQPENSTIKGINDLSDIIDQTADPAAKAFILAKTPFLIEHTFDISRITCLLKLPIRIPASANPAIPFQITKTTANLQPIIEPIIQNISEAEKVFIQDPEANSPIKPAENTLLPNDTPQKIVQELNSHIPERQPIEIFTEPEELIQMPNPLRKIQPNESQTADRTGLLQKSEILKPAEINSGKVDSTDYHSNQKPGENDYYFKAHGISNDKEFGTSSKSTTSSLPEAQPNDSEIETGTTSQVEKNLLKHNTEILTKTRESQPVSTKFEAIHQVNLTRPTQTSSINKLPDTALNRDMFPIINHIGELVIQSVKTGRHTLNVRIATDTLGEIELRFVNDPEENRGTIIVNSEKTQTLIQKCLPLIQENLSQKEIFFASLEVEINPSNQQHFTSNHKNKSAGKHLNFPADAIVTQTEINKIHDFGYNSIEIVA
jgi:hypothetical protein